MGCREQPHFRAGLCASPRGLATLGKEPIPVRQWQRNPSAFPPVPNLGVQSSGTALPVPRSPQFPSSRKRVLECDFVALFSPWPHMAASVLGYLFLLHALMSILTRGVEANTVHRLQRTEPAPASAAFVTPPLHHGCRDPVREDKLPNLGADGSAFQELGDIFNCLFFSYSHHLPCPQSCLSRFATCIS